jgi:hypothetical protein
MNTEGSRIAGHRQAQGECRSHGGDRELLHDRFLSFWRIESLGCLTIGTRRSAGNRAAMRNFRVCWFARIPENSPPKLRDCGGEAAAKLTKDEGLTHAVPN